MGLRFSLAILQEIDKVSVEILASALQHLYEALSESPAGSLYGNDVLAFQQDTALDEAREFLVRLIGNRSQYPKKMVELCMKILLRPGIVRSNVEDFLIVSKLLNGDVELAGHCDLRSDIRALPVVDGA
jgi:hypothetical protein